MNVTREALLKRMKDYYDGFCFDGVTRLYNPFSMSSKNNFQNKNIFYKEIVFSIGKGRFFSYFSRQKSTGIFRCSYSFHCLIAGFVGAAWSCLIIAVAWVRFQPLLAVTLAGAAEVICLVQSSMDTLQM